MRNVSNEYIQTMERRRDFYPEAEITFSDGTKKTLAKDDFALSGNSITEAAGSSSFPIGLVVPKQITLSIMNQDDQWSEYDFYHAIIVLKTKFNLDSGKTETLNIGRFSVITPETYGTVIDVTAVDGSCRLDRDYKTSIPYPATVGEAVRDSCAACGVSLLTATFNNSDFVIEKKPENLTHRQFIGLCAMISGGNAKFDEYNRLKIMTYDFSVFEESGLDGGIFDGGEAGKYATGDAADGGAFKAWNAGYAADGGSFGDRRNMHVLYQFKSGMKIDVDDVVITGVQLMDAEKNAHLYGKEGYVLSLENQLAAGKESEVAQMIGEKVVGLRFRPFTGDIVAYPMAEFMDPAVIMDYKYNVYQTVLTDVDFQYCGFTTLKCSADSPIRNSSKYYGNEVKAIVEANKLVEKEKTEREKAVEELAGELAQSSGLYMTEDVQPDGSTIYYMHDKQTLAESMIVWKLTAEAFGISTDGGKTYPYGLDATGMAILNRIYAIGINCDYLTTGSFEIIKNGKVMVRMDKDIGDVILRPDVFELSNGDTIQSIAEQEAENAVDGQTQDDIFNKLFMPDGVPVDGVKLEDGKIYMSASYIYTGTLTLGGLNNSDGKMQVLDALRKEIVRCDKDGIYAINGEIGGMRIGNYGIAGGDKYYAETTTDGTESTYLGKKGLFVYSQSKNRISIEKGMVHFYDSSPMLQGGIGCGGSDYGDVGFGIYQPVGGSAPSNWKRVLKPGAVVTFGNTKGITIIGDLAIEGGAASSGIKSRISKTKNYNDRLLYCYEMPSPMFGDIGQGQTDENGECYIDIGDIFSETIAAEIEYQVFLQKEGKGDIWIAEKNPHYFLVKGTENLKFSWEIKAKQKGFEYERLENYSDEPQDDAPADYESEYMEEIERLMKEQEELLYEAT